VPNPRKRSAKGPARHDGKAWMTLEQEIARLLSIENSQGALYLALRSYGQQLLEFLVGCMSDEADARDVLSMTLDAALSDVSSFAGRVTFRAWLYILAKNARVRFMTDPSRYRGRRSSYMSSLADLVILGRSELARLDEARMRRDFTDEDRELLALHFHRQFSWAEIAAIWSVGREPLGGAAVRVRCQRLVALACNQSGAA